MLKFSLADRNRRYDEDEREREREIFNGNLHSAGIGKWENFHKISHDTFSIR